MLSRARSFTAFVVEHGIGIGMGIKMGSFEELVLMRDDTAVMCIV